MSGVDQFEIKVNTLAVLETKYSLSYGNHQIALKCGVQENDKTSTAHRSGTTVAGTIIPNLGVANCQD